MLCISFVMATHFPIVRRYGYCGESRAHCDIYSTLIVIAKCYYYCTTILESLLFVTATPLYTCKRMLCNKVEKLHQLTIFFLQKPAEKLAGKASSFFLFPIVFFVEEFINLKFPVVFIWVSRYASCKVQTSSFHDVNILRILFSFMNGLVLSPFLLVQSFWP